MDKQAEALALAAADAEGAGAGGGADGGGGAVDNPFDSSDEEEEVVPWELEGAKEGHAATFEALGPVDGKLSGRAVKGTLTSSGLKRAQLKRVWTLADIDEDG